MSIKKQDRVITKTEKTKKGFSWERWGERFILKISANIMPTIGYRFEITRRSSPERIFSSRWYIRLSTGIGYPKLEYQYRWVMFHLCINDTHLDIVQHPGWMFPIFSLYKIEQGDVINIAWMKKIIHEF